MPIRRLNYTKRRKVHRDDVDIVIQTTVQGRAAFEVTLRLASYRFPENAVLSVEAYRRTRVMRFPLGTVSLPSSGVRYELSDFDSDEDVLFRVKVTDVADRPGVLLGHADKLRARRPDELPDKRIPLLPPIPSDLEEEVWRLEFDSEPRLLINSRLPNWKETVKSNSFRALVYPTVVREILTRVLLIDKETSSEDSESWQSRWLRFAASIPGVGDVPKSPEDHDDWIVDAASAFSRRFNMRSRYTSEVSSEQ